MLSLVTTKSKSRIRIDSKSKNEPQHSAVLLHLFTNEEYKNISVPFAKKVINCITPKNLDSILKEYPTDILSEKRKKLIKNFLTYKIITINEILKGG